MFKKIRHNKNKKNIKILKMMKIKWLEDKIIIENKEKEEII